jgi:hypothetical protein
VSQLLPTRASRIRAQGGGLARSPVPLRIRLMIGCAIAEGVVCHLVVIPDRDERVLPVCLLQIGIGFVLRVPLPVLLQRYRLTIRAGHAIDDGAITKRAVPVFVQIVPEVQHEI